MLLTALLHRDTCSRAPGVLGRFPISLWSFSHQDTDWSRV